ncbi:MAG: GNAT family N-acetyltransferase [Xanthobacteraceae bacterium]
MNEMPGAATAAYGRRGAVVAPTAGRACLHAQSATLPGIHIAIYDDLACVERAWRAFEPHADCTVFQNFDYLAAWQKHIGSRAGVAPALVLIRRGDDLLAILPLALAGGGWLRRLTWLGLDLSDYLAPLLRNDFTGTISHEQFAALWLEIRTLLQANPRFRHDLIDLRNMPEFVGGQRNPLVALTATLHPSEGYIATLPGDWDTFYRARRSSKARRQDRTKLKRLGEIGDVRMITPERRDDIALTIKTLIAQKSATFARKGISDKFQRPGYREFFFELALDQRTGEMVHTSELRVGSMPAAVSFGLQYRDRYSLCLVSYDEDFSRDSPGAIHLNELMHRAIDRGMHEFDFLVGSQRLKREWSDRRIPLYDHIAAATTRGWPVAAMSRALSRVKRAIKTSPALWDAFVRIRAFAGTLNRRRGAESED